MTVKWVMRAKKDGFVCKTCTFLHSCFKAIFGKYFGVDTQDLTECHSPVTLTAIPNASRQMTTRESLRKWHAARWLKAKVEERSCLNCKVVRLTQAFLCCSVRVCLQRCNYILELHQSPFLLSRLTAVVQGPMMSKTTECAPEIHIQVGDSLPRAYRDHVTSFCRH